MIEKMQDNIAQNKKQTSACEKKIDGLHQNIQSFSEQLPEIMTLLGIEFPEDLEFTENNLGLLKEYLSEIETRVCKAVDLHKMVEEQQVIFYFYYTNLIQLMSFYPNLQMGKTTAIKNFTKNTIASTAHDIEVPKDSEEMDKIKEIEVIHNLAKDSKWHIFYIIEILSQV